MCQVIAAECRYTLPIAKNPDLGTSVGDMNLGEPNLAMANPRVIGAIETTNVDSVVIGLGTTKLGTMDFGKMNPEAKN